MIDLLEQQIQIIFKWLKKYGHYYKKRDIFINQIMKVIMMFQMNVL